MRQIKFCLSTGLQSFPLQVLIQILKNLVKLVQSHTEIIK